MHKIISYLKIDKIFLLNLKLIINASDSKIETKSGIETKNPLKLNFGNKKPQVNIKNNILLTDSLNVFF